MTDSNGQFGRGPMPIERLRVPSRIVLQGRVLSYWEDDRDPEPFRWAEPRGILRAFVRIETPEQVLRFAQKYGPLWLCPHGMPPHADPETGLWCPPCGQEPVDRWLGYADRARALLKVAAAMAQGGGHGDARRLLQDGLNRWLETSSVRPRLDWTGRFPVFQLAGGGALGAIGAELLYTVTASHGLAVCSGCGAVYLRTGRRPKTGQRNWCDDCRTSVANRERQARWRERQRQRKGEGR